MNIETDGVIEADSKIIISNFRPVSVLSTISKISKLTIKNQLVPYLDNVFSPFLSLILIRIIILNIYFFDHLKNGKQLCCRRNINGSTKSV